MNTTSSTLPACEHVESKSIQGVGLIKLQFHPGTDMAQAPNEARRSATSTAPAPLCHGNRGRLRDAVRRWQRPGRRPRLLQQDEDSRRASGRGALQGAPVVRDLARALSATAAVRLQPAHILVRLDPDKLRSYNMSPDEVVQALGAGNTVSQSGKRPHRRPHANVPVNSVVGDFNGLNNIPIRSHGTQDDLHT